MKQYSVLSLIQSLAILYASSVQFHDRVASKRAWLRRGICHVTHVRHINSIDCRSALIVSIRNTDFFFGGGASGNFLTKTPQTAYLFDKSAWETISTTNYVLYIQLGRHINYLYRPALTGR